MATHLSEFPGTGVMSTFDKVDHTRDNQEQDST